MSCLYSSPEVTSLEVTSLEVTSLEVTSLELPLSSFVSWFARFGAWLPRAESKASLSSTQICRTSQSKDAFPQRPGVAGPHQIIPPAKTSTGFEREFSSARSGFRSLCGRKRRSSLKPSRSKGPAFWNLSLGRALALRTLASTRNIPFGSIYGASNPGPMLWMEGSRSRGIFQVVFLRSNQALSGRFPAGDGPRNAGQIGLWRSLKR
jgi:hypothetical protein